MSELDLLVGSIFTARPEDDRELFDEEKEWLSDVQDLLREEGIEIDLLSRPGAEIWEGSIDRFMDLYQLRLFAVYLERGQDPSAALQSTQEPEDEPDSLLVSIWEGDETTRFPNVVNHQADGGYYLPVDFAEPIWLEVDEDQVEEVDEDDDEQVVSFGSSIALQRELVELEGLLKQAGLTTSDPAYRCLQVLQTAANQSVSNDLPIIIW